MSDGAAQVSPRGYIDHPAWVYLIILRREVLRVQAVDPSLPMQSMLDASRAAMLAAGWTDEEIDREDRYNVKDLRDHPPLTSQQIGEENRKKDEAERAAAEAKVAA